MEKDVYAVSMVAAILLTRHDHPLDNKIEGAVKTAVKILDTAEKIISLPPAPNPNPPNQQ